MRNYLLLFLLTFFTVFVGCETDEIFDLNEDIKALTATVYEHESESLERDNNNFQALQAIINAVVEAQAEVNTALAAADLAEAEARQQADNALKAELEAEVRERMSEVARLELEAEKTEIALRKLIADEVATLNELLAAEEAARIAADDSLSTRLQAEIATRIKEDQRLQDLTMAVHAKLVQEVGRLDNLIDDLEERADILEMEMEVAVESQIAALNAYNESIYNGDSVATANAAAAAAAGAVIDEYAAQYGVQSELGVALLLLNIADTNVVTYLDSEIASLQSQIDDNAENIERNTDRIVEVRQEMTDAAEALEAVNNVTELADNESSPWLDLSEALAAFVAQHNAEEVALDAEEAITNATIVFNGNLVTLYNGETPSLDGTFDFRHTDEVFIPNSTVTMKEEISGNGGSYKSYDLLVSDQSSNQAHVIAPFGDYDAYLDISVSTTQVKKTSTRVIIDLRLDKNDNLKWFLVSDSQAQDNADDISDNADDIDDLEGEIARLDGEIETLEGLIEDLDERLDIAEEDIEDIEGDISEIKDDIVDIIADVAVNTDDIEEAKSDISELEGNLDMLTDDVEDNTEDIEDLVADIVAANNLITGLTSDVLELETEVAGLVSDVLDLETELGQVSETLADAIDDAADLADEVSELETELSAAVSDTLVNADAIAQLESDLLDAQQSLAAAEADIDSLEAEHAALQGEIDEIDGDLAEAVAQVAANKEDIEELEEAIDEIEVEAGNSDQVQNLLKSFEIDVNLVITLSDTSSVTLAWEDVNLPLESNDPIDLGAYQFTSAWTEGASIATEGLQVSVDTEGNVEVEANAGFDHSTFDSNIAIDISSYLELAPVDIDFDFGDLVQAVDTVELTDGGSIANFTITLVDGYRFNDNYGLSDTLITETDYSIGVGSNYGTTATIRIDLNDSFAHEDTTITEDLSSHIEGAAKVAVFAKVRSNLISGHAQGIDFVQDTDKTVTFYKASYQDYASTGTVSGTFTGGTYEYTVVANQGNAFVVTFNFDSSYDWSNTPNVNLDLTSEFVDKEIEFALQLKNGTDNFGESQDITLLSKNGEYWDVTINESDLDGFTIDAATEASGYLDEGTQNFSYVVQSSATQLYIRVDYIGISGEIEGDEGTFSIDVSANITDECEDFNAYAAADVETDGEFIESANKITVTVNGSAYQAHYYIVYDFETHVTEGLDDEIDADETVIQYKRGGGSFNNTVDTSKYLVLFWNSEIGQSEKAEIIAAINADQSTVTLTNSNTVLDAADDTGQSGFRLRSTVSSAAGCGDINGNEWNPKSESANRLVGKKVI